LSDSSLSVSEGDESNRVLQEAKFNQLSYSNETERMEVNNEKEFFN